MSAKVTGLADLGAFLNELPLGLEQNILRGALRAGAEEFAKGAREECVSAEVRGAIKTSSRAQPGLITAKVETKGPGAYIAPWLEYGTDPHLISVDAEEAGGRTVRRINRLAKKEALLLGGGAFAKSVHHPGATAKPFMRPAVDTREDAAIDAIGGYIARRLTKEGLTTPPEPEPDE